MEFSEPSVKSPEFVFLIHGGAGVIDKGFDGSKHTNALKSILIKTYEFAQLEDSTAVDIAEHAVRLLEDEELFNAGRGSVYTSTETHEMEASIMDGSNLENGAVSMITSIKNPISLARLVMDKSIHSFLIGSTAEALGTTHSLPIADQTYFDSPHRLKQLHLAKESSIICNDHDLEKAVQDQGTVGCVVMKRGHLASATSTGGMTNKAPGRIGDTPIVGAGTYANNRTCAVSCTGNGEDFMRHVAAYDVSAFMEYGVGGNGVEGGLEKAAKHTVWEKLPLDSGGLIAVDSMGNTSMPFNSLGMFRGRCDSSGRGATAIWEEEYPFTV